MPKTKALIIGKENVPALENDELERLVFDWQDRKVAGFKEGDTVELADVRSIDKRTILAQAKIQWIGREEPSKIVENIEANPASFGCDGDAGRKDKFIKTVLSFENPVTVEIGEIQKSEPARDDDEGPDQKYAVGGIVTVKGQKYEVFGYNEQNEVMGEAVNPDANPGVIAVPEDQVDDYDAPDEEEDFEIPEFTTPKVASYDNLEQKAKAFEDAFNKEVEINRGLVEQLRALKGDNPHLATVDLGPLMQKIGENDDRLDDAEDWIGLLKVHFLENMRGLLPELADICSKAWFDLKHVAEDCADDGDAIAKLSIPVKVSFNSLTQLDSGIELKYSKRTTIKGRNLAKNILQTELRLEMAPATPDEAQGDSPGSQEEEQEPDTKVELPAAEEPETQYEEGIPVFDFYGSLPPVREIDGQEFTANQKNEDPEEFIGSVFIIPEMGDTEFEVTGYTTIKDAEGVNIIGLVIGEPSEEDEGKGVFVRFDQIRIVN